MLEWYINYIVQAFVTKIVFPIIFLSWIFKLPDIISVVTYIFYGWFYLWRGLIEIYWVHSFVGHYIINRLICESKTSTTFNYVTLFWDSFGFATFGERSRYGICSCTPPLYYVRSSTAVALERPLPSNRLVSAPTPCSSSMAITTRSFPPGWFIRFTKPSKEKRSYGSPMARNMHFRIKTILKNTPKG